MKKFVTSILLLCSVLTLSAQSLVMKVTLTDGTSKEFAVSEVQGITFDQEPYVDLGLESGVKWATMNVGATSETDPGTPYKWNEAESIIKNEWTQLHGDKEWRMPTKEEFQELIDACAWSEYKDAEGKVVGYKVAKKGNENLFIVLPFDDYWTGTAYDLNMGWYLSVTTNSQSFDAKFKIHKLAIRPVWGKPIVTATIETGEAQPDFTSVTIPVKVSSESDIEVASYGVKYSTHADMTGATIVRGNGNLSANTFKSVLIEDLEPGTTYYYQAYAELTTPALSLLSEPIASFTTRAKELTVSAEVSYKSSTAATLDLGFTGNVRGTIYYKVLYGQDKNLVEDTEATLKKQGTWELTSAGVAQYVSVDLVDLEPGKTYYYRVIAKYADFEATPVNGSFDTDSQEISVTASTKAAGATTATVSMSLTSNVVPCQVTYYVEYGLDELLQNSSKTTERTVTLTSATGQTIDVDLSGLKEGETYYYHAVAKVGSLVKASELQSFTTVSKTLTVSASVYATSATTAQAALTFRGNVTGSGRYKLYYGEDDNLDQQLPAGEFTINRADVTVTQYVGLSNLKPNQKYSVQLVAGYDEALDKSSDIETFQTPAKTLTISSVSASNITAKAATISIAVSANSPENVSYEVKYSKNEDMSDELKKEGNIQLETTNGETISVGIDQLEEETTYYYQVTVCYTTDTAISDTKSGNFKTPEKVTFKAPDKVDLGCSVLWGSFNLGAKDETGRGSFFGWGDPTGEKISQTERYGDSGLTPPVDLTTSHQELDIVHVTLEDNWHTPTAAQMLELLEKCTWTHKTNYMGVDGLDGYEVRGKGQYAENSIFIPHYGCRTGVDNNGNAIMSSNINESYYWSSQLTDSPWGYGVFVKLQKGTIKSEVAQTFYGMYIRPVYGEGSGKPDIPDPDEDCSLEIDSITPSGMIIPADGVDLGLSVKWASWNVGTTDSTTVNNKTVGAVGQYGGYYSWGETSTKPRYSNTDYTLNLTEKILAPEHDAAHVNWGGDWRMPTEDEWDELVLNCSVQWETATWKTADGQEHYTQGYRYTSKVPGYTDRSIFLPAGGADSGSGPFGMNQYGYYWSSSKHLSLPNVAVCLLFSSDGVYNDPSITYERFGGLLIRPVKPIEKSE